MTLDPKYRTSTIQITRRLLAKLKNRTYYPDPPKSGLVRTVKVRSSREWWDWWKSLDEKQRDQFIADAFKTNHGENI